MEIQLEFGGRTARLVGLDETDHITKMIRQTASFYEAHLLEEIFHRAMPGWVFVDAGAHIGNHSVFFGAILGLEGYALEQNPDTFRTLTDNIEANSLGATVHLINAAVGSEFGKARTISDADRHNSGLDSIALDPAGTVEVIPLDSLELPRLDLLKIDVEGFELECLKGSSATIARCAPLIVAEAIDRQRFNDLASFLAPYGYAPTRRYNVTPTYLFERHA